ncbi:MAG: TetR/AcrR family transcriptional regulator [Eubacteriales bacterium]|nr:TetR/AcrR family transcriptional regulator [Eubacteriales bacterium]
MKQGVTDHRVKVTQAMIRKAFTELLREKPIQSISIKELCERAGINRGTFYAHYQDIYELKQTFEDELYSELQKNLSPLMDPNSQTSQMEICEWVFGWLKENRDICSVILSRYENNHFLMEMLQIGRLVCRESYVNQGKKCSTEQIERFYSFVSGGFIALMRDWLEEGMETPVKEMAHTAVQLMMHGADALGTL